MYEAGGGGEYVWRRALRGSRSAFAIVDPNRSLSRRCNDLNFCVFFGCEKLCVADTKACSLITRSQLTNYCVMPPVVSEFWPKRHERHTQQFKSLHQRLSDLLGSTIANADREQCRWYKALQPYYALRSKRHERPTQKLEVITSTVQALGNLNRVDKSTAERWIYVRNILYTIECIDMHNS